MRVINNLKLKLLTNFMHNIRKLVYLTTAFLMILGSFSAGAQKFEVKSSKSFIQGTSSLHDWESQITKIECKGNFQSKDKMLNTLNDVEVKIEVEGIKSKEGRIMDHKTYEAFTSDKYPYITYSFTTAKISIDAQKNITIKADGKLTMAGVTLPISLTASGKELANGDLQLKVIKKLKMTDFKMKPPTAVLGTIKAGDEITVNFDMVLSRSKISLK